MRVCKHCGTALQQDQPVCPRCGTSVNAIPKQKRPYWIFAIAGLLIVIVILCAVLFAVLQNRGTAPTTDRPTTLPEPITEPSPLPQPEPDVEPERDTQPEPEAAMPEVTQPIETPDVVPSSGVQTASYINYVCQNRYFYEQNGLRYYDDGVVEGFPIIDVSAYQPSIDWYAVKAAGIDAALIRVGYRGWGSAGTLKEDEYFHSHMQGALAAGLDVGVYFFSQATTEAEAIQEAQLALDLIEGYSIAYPVMFDWEETVNEGGRTVGMQMAQTTACAKAFCQTVEQAGYEGGIYFDYRRATEKYDLSELSQYAFWYANRADTPDSSEPFAIWQYTNQGVVPGIGSAVDINVMFRQK